MFELPLFPLYTVLFPSIPLHLHIFEERYKRMIRLCLENQGPFGVVLIRQGAEALGPLAKPFSIGCTAQIKQVQRLEEGRMNITAVGQERFRIISLVNRSSPYLVGEVEPYPLLVANWGQVQEAGQRLGLQVRRYLSRLAESGKSSFDLQQLPGDPVSLAYMAAAMAQISAPQKQELLEQESAEDLLAGLEAVYRRELALLKALLAGNIGEKGAFSQN